jgi:two-component system, OmpR family, response regulator TctD
MARVDRVVPKDELLAAVFGDAVAIQPDALDVLVYRLRRKLAGAGAEVANLRGIGYLLRDEAVAPRADG